MKGRFVSHYSIREQFKTFLNRFWCLHPDKGLTLVKSERFYISLGKSISADKYYCERCKKFFWKSIEHSGENI